MKRIFNLIFSLVMLQLGAKAQVPVPYFNDFETDTSGWTMTSIDFQTLWQWGSPNYGVTNSSHSGVKCWDINLTAPYGSNALATLTSPVFQLDASLHHQLSFWYNYSTETGWDGTRIEYSLNYQSWVVLGTVNDPNATNWYNDSLLNASLLPAWQGISSGWTKATYELQGMGGLPIQFRFVFESDGSFIDDGFSIDDFSIEKPLDNDLRITNMSVIEPFPYATLSDSIAVTIHNYGNLPANNFQVETTYNGLTLNSVTIPNTIAPGTYKVVKTPGINTSVLGTICAKCVYNNDQDTSNNITCKEIESLYATFTPDYFNDFEAEDGSWYSFKDIGFSNQIWHWGTPSYGANTGAYSGIKCWGLNLDTTYGDTAFAFLYSPHFNLTGANQPYISFQMNYTSQPLNDGVWMEYELNNNGTWFRLGNMNDVNGLNWYTSDISGIPSPSWEGTSNGWKPHTYKLPPSFANSNVQFRFVFYSDFSIHTDGFSIDDFSVYNIKPTDVSIKGLSKNMNGQVAGTQDLKLVIKNEGLLFQSNISIHYDINGSSGNIIYTGSLAPGMTDTLTLQNISLPAGLNTVEAYLQYPGDQNHINDTLRTSFNLIQGIPIPYFTDFTDSSGWIPQFVNSSWQFGLPAYGVTNSAMSPPSCWDILLSNPYYSNMYQYVQSPMYNIIGNTGFTLNMSVNYSTELYADGVTLQYSTDGINFQTLGTINDPMATNWYNGVIGTGSPGWSGNSGGWRNVRIVCNQFQDATSIQFRMHFSSNTTISGDGFSFDDFYLSPALALDASAFNITNIPASFPSSVPQTVKAGIINYGINSVSGFPVMMSVNGGTPVTVIYNGTLNSGQRDSVVFPSQLFFGGTNIIKVYTGLPSDGNNLNDTISLTVFGELTVVPPYSENFDTGLPTWQSLSLGLNGSEWELGTPSTGSTNSSHTPPNCWDINLAGQYNNVALSYLYTPYLNLTNSGSVDFSFWTNYNTESGADGMYIEYSMDDITWNIVGTVNDPAGVNWYNSTITGSKPGWSGNSNGWVMCRYKTNAFAFAPSVRLRFVFRSDLSFVTDGVSVDDFTITTITGLNGAKNVKLNIYPNPAKDELILFMEEAMEYSIADISGRKVLEGNVFAGKNSIDIKVLQSGSYVIMGDSDNTRFINSFIKE